MAEILSIAQFDADAMLTTGEVASILRMHRTKAHELCATGKIRSMRNGSRFLVKVKWLNEYIEASTLPYNASHEQIRRALRGK